MKAMRQTAENRQEYKTVRVHIEDLVLHGFLPSDRRGITAALEQELARLIGERGLPAMRGNPLPLDRMHGGTFKVLAGAKSQAAGTEIAGAIFQSLRQHARASGRASRAHPGTGGHRP
jgi:hypothetical protein